jgi:DNA repair exonuclease SbcCD ATPase subunit
MELIQAIAAIASALAAVLAWVAKIRWSNEFAAAKDETIRTKEAQIEFLEREIKGLQEMTPMKIREYFLSVTEQLEEFNDRLQKEKTSLQSQLKEKDLLLREFKESKIADSEKIKQLTYESEQLREGLAQAETATKEVQRISAKTERVRDFLRDSESELQRLRNIYGNVGMDAVITWPDSDWTTFVEPKTKDDKQHKDEPSKEP